MIAVITGYIRYQALDDETFKNTSEELIADPVIRDQVRDETLIKQLYASVDVEAELERRLPQEPARARGTAGRGSSRAS